MASPQTLLAPCVETVPGKRGGRPCVIYTRIEAEMLYGLWNDGYSLLEIYRMYPDITYEMAEAAVAFWAGVVWAKAGKLEGDE